MTHKNPYTFKYDVKGCSFKCSPTALLSHKKLGIFNFISGFFFIVIIKYEKKKIKSIAKDDVSLIDNNDEISKKKLKKLKEMYKPLTEWWKKFLGA